VHPSVAERDLCVYVASNQLALAEMGLGDQITAYRAIPPVGLKWRRGTTEALMSAQH
jgi:hypothetical protein